MPKSPAVNFQKHFKDSEELCSYVAGFSESVLVPFSTGKDSIAMILQLKRYFKKIYPYYFYFIPDLSFVNEQLDYLSEKLQIGPIVQLPHPTLNTYLNNLIFQAPENCHIIEKARMYEYNWHQVARVMKQDLGLDPLKTFSAKGIQAADSLVRNINIKRWGSLNPRGMEFFPVFDWKQDRTIKEIKDAGIHLPADYVMFGRSFDGFEYRYMKPIRDNFPEDWKKVERVFPLIRLQIMREEMREKYLAEDSTK